MIRAFLHGARQSVLRQKNTEDGDCEIQIVDLSDSKQILWPLFPAALLFNNFIYIEKV